MFLQLVGTALGKKFALTYACLSLGYFETILFPRLLRIHFTLTECKLMEEIFKCFMDDGLWATNANIDVIMDDANIDVIMDDANIDVFRELLNELHLSLKFTVEKGKNSCEQNFDTLYKF